MQTKFNTGDILFFIDNLSLKITSRVIKTIQIYEDKNIDYVFTDKAVLERCVDIIDTTTSFLVTNYCVSTKEKADYVVMVLKELQVLINKRIEEINKALKEK